MGHDQLFDALSLLSLLWLSMLVYGVWLQRRLAASQTTPTPATPITKRSKEPPPFVGLIHKPHCDACEHAIELHPQAPSSLPPLLTFTRGRQRTIDTQQHFCPTHECPYYGWVGRGNIRANGHPGGKPWRQLQCVACQRYFQETHGTVFHATRVSPQMLVWAVGALAEGLGIRAVARVFEVDPNTVLQWLVEAADQLQAFSRYVLHDLEVTQVQLDELFALLSAVKAGEVSDAVRGARLKPRWMPLPQLLYAQGVKQYRRRRVVRVRHRAVFGTLEAVQQRLAAHRWHINTAFIERVNLSIRQHVAAVGRRVTTLCKHEAGLRQQLAVYQVYYNFCLPHASLRLPLPQPEPTNGTGSAKRWRPRTPAMVAGLTDHTWTLREVLLFRVPPWPQLQAQAL